MFDSVPASKSENVVGSCARKDDHIRRRKFCSSPVSDQDEIRSELKKDSSSFFPMWSRRIAYLRYSQKERANNEIPRMMLVIIWGGRESKDGATRAPMNGRTPKEVNGRAVERTAANAKTTG